MGATVPNVFASQSGNVPASQIDADFTAILNWINAKAIGGYGIRNLVGQNDAGTPNTKFGFSADLVGLRNPTDGSVVIQTNTGTLTCDTGLAGSAANGRDQAGAFVASSWIHFYSIWNGTTLATLSSATAPPTGPTLPTGYTHWAYVGTVFYNATPVLVKTRMRGCWMVLEVFKEVLTAGAAQVETAISLTSVVPPNALMIAAWYANTAAVLMDIRYVSGSNFIESSTVDRSTFVIPNLAQNLFYIMGAAGGVLYMEITGYSVPNGGE